MVKQVAAPILMTLFALTLLGIAAWLKPNPMGMGTHEQLGLPSCSFLIHYGKPCPFCGMTTSYSHMVRGQVLQSARTHPLGAILAFVTFLVPLYSGSVLVRRKPFFPKLYYRRWPWLLLALVVLCLLSWVYKIAAYSAILPKST
ncbi:MAG: DUF2752 domain-containing protein [Planctomycetota bacterium]|jgi:hypothetical protein|nr:DUF2752 domain-containing protein [Planctomycetota bacterium]